MANIDRRTFIRTLALFTSAGVASLTGCSPEELASELETILEEMEEEDSLDLSASSGETIIIVGAGIAGLAAGQRLKEEGFDVTILEARDRIGGRIWTNNDLGLPLDLGASWIHGVRNNPLTRIANQNNIRRVETDYESIAVYRPDGSQLSDSYLEELEATLKRMGAQLAEMGEELDNDISLGTALRQAISEMNISPQELQDLTYMINSAIEHEYAADVSNLSLWWFDEGDEYGGEDVIFPGGYGQIIDVLADGQDIRTNHVVLAVNYGSNGVTVTTDQGTFEGDRVIVTLPHGVLKAGTVQFSPPLPADKQSAISYLQSGVLNKLYLRFPSVFWDDEVLLGLVSETKGHWAESLNLDNLLDEPILLMFNAGTFGREIENWADQVIVDDAMQSLRSMYGPSIPDPIDYLVTRWGTDPYAYGSYSSMGAGGTPADRAALAEPVNGVLLFAGEATSTDFPATAHGALLSGWAAADQLIG